MYIEQHTHTKKIITMIVNKVNGYYKQCSAVNKKITPQSFMHILAATFVQTIIFISQTHKH